MPEDWKISSRAVRIGVIVGAMGLSFLLGLVIRSGHKGRPTPQEIAERDATALPTGFIVKDLNGVDLSGLDDRKRLIALDIVNRVPCLASTGGISVARCRRDAPSCVTSQRIADFTVDMVRRGYGKEQVLVAVYDKALSEDRNRPKISDTVIQLLIEGLPFVGEKDAPVKVVLFYDYTAPISRKALQSAEQLHNLYPKNVKLLYWPAPMTRLRAGAERAAQVAIAAFNLGGFDKVHALLVQNEGRAGENDLSNYVEKAQMPSLIDEANSEKVIKKVETLESTVSGIGIEFPPVFFVQGRRITGPVPGVCFLMDAVQQALAASIRAEYKSLEERIAP